MLCQWPIHLLSWRGSGSDRSLSTATFRILRLSSTTRISTSRPVFRKCLTAFKKRERPKGNDEHQSEHKRKDDQQHQGSDVKIHFFSFKGRRFARICEETLEKENEERIAPSPIGPGNPQACGPRRPKGATCAQNVTEAAQFRLERPSQQ